MKMYELRELALLKIMGGKPTSEVKIEEAAVKVFLPIAIAAITTNELMVSPRQKGMVDKSAYSSTVCLPVKYDEKKCESYIELPSIISSPFPKGGIIDIWSLKGEEYHGIADRFAARGLEALSAETTTWWVENGSTIVFANISPFVKEVLVRGLFSASALSDDDNVPLPESSVGAALELVVAHFVQERQMPEDELVDNIDNK